MDQTWELPIIQTLNTLGYLKAKRQHDNELIKKHNTR